MGLVNRVVGCGTAIGQAVNIASVIAKFPQQCLKVDKQNAYHATYDAADFESASDHELDYGTKVLATESVDGNLLHDNQWIMPFGFHWFGSRLVYNNCSHHQVPNDSWKATAGMEVSICTVHPKADGRECIESFLVRCSGCSSTESCILKSRTSKHRRGPGAGKKFYRNLVNF